MRSRYLNELTTPEVEAYFERGGDVALLPVGCVEMHGPHQPVGTDTFIAKAFALRLAEQAGGLVLPEVCYTWSGATDGFAGTLSIEPETEARLIESIVLKAHRTGFRRIGIVNVHGPGRKVIGMVIRRVFETHAIPAALLLPYNPMSDEAAEVFDGDLGAAKEASLVLAALEILGQGGLYKQEDMAYEDQAPPEPRSYWALRPGLVGFFMQDPRQHACPSPHVSLERGRRFYELQLESMAEVFDHLKEYAAAAEKQANKGTWRQ